MTQPGRSAWAVVLVTLCFGESTAGRISSGAETSSSFTSWSSRATQHWISLQLEHGGVQRAASGSRAARLHNARGNYLAPLAVLTGMFPVSVGYWSDWAITCRLQWCCCTLHWSGWKVTLKPEGAHGKARGGLSHSGGCQQGPKPT